MSDRPTITLDAPAKLNLALSVGPPADDGMHPICSWMVTVDLCDQLQVTRLEDDRLSRYAILWHPEAKRRTEIDWSITRDLAVQAHLALERRAGRRLPVQMKLDKRIPVGGGLGGGSSNAAAMLVAGNTLFELGYTDAELAAIGAELGADVPFFIHGGHALVEGRGEHVRPLPPCATWHAVIVMPSTACNTGAVYAAFDKQGATALQPEAVIDCTTAGAPRSEQLFNDLAPAAFALAPQLETILADLSRLAERPAHLTGSGACLFVVCDDQLHAAALCTTIETQLDLPAAAVRTTEMLHAETR